MSPRLTIGMATYDDFDGVYFSLQSIRLFHAEVLPQVEFLVVDNRPDSPHGLAVRNLVEGWIPNGRYVAFPEVHGTALPRDRVFREAAGDAVLCIDSHVLLVPGALARLIDYYDRHPDCRDLLQGPMLNDDCRDVHATHMAPVWRAEMFGVWSKDPRADDIDAEPFEVPMHGLGLFSCLRESWPGFNPHFRGFGGEEGYLHEKFRKAGARTLCLPFLRWLHRFGRPDNVPYRLTRDDKLRNYLLGWTERGLDTASAIQHFRPLLPAESLERIQAEVSGRLGESAPSAAAPCRAAAPSAVSGRTRPAKVSCLMATYGRWSQVCESLACFLAQDYPDKELIILNNHPTPLAFEHPDVRIVNEPGHPHLGACRNRLLELADGEFCRTWDDDDLYLPWAISQGVAHIGGAPAFKPRRSWLWERGRGFRLCENVLEASWTVRTEVARRYGFDEKAGNEHEALARGIEQEGGMRIRDFGVHASYVYRWGHGLHHISGTLCKGGELAQRTSEWMAAHTDTGDGQPLVPAGLAEYWRELSDGCGVQSGEIARRALREPPDRAFEVPKDQQLRTILDLCFDGRENLTAAEFGRLRGTSERHRAGDGWSTWQLATDRRIRTVYSIDPDPATVAQCRSAIPTGAIEKVVFLADAREAALAAITEPIDLLLIDADDLPFTNLQCLHAVKRQLSDIAVIAVDDFRFGRKPVLIRTALEPTHESRLAGDCIVFTPRKLPECLLWQTFLEWPAE